MYTPELIDHSRKSQECIVGGKNRANSVGTWAMTCLVITTNVGLNHACPNNHSDQEFRAACESIRHTVLSVTVDVLQTHEAAQIF